MVSEREVMDKQISLPCLLALCAGGNTPPLLGVAIQQQWASTDRRIQRRKKAGWTAPM